MKIYILKCPKCGSYGLKEICTCGSKREVARPPKYSPLDQYAKYRRLKKAEEMNLKWDGNY